VSLDPSVIITYAEAPTGPRMNVRQQGQMRLNCFEAEIGAKLEGEICFEIFINIYQFKSRRGHT
jgi:hypothetical protein